MTGFSSLTVQQVMNASEQLQQVNGTKLQWLVHYSSVAMTVALKRSSFQLGRRPCLHLRSAPKKASAST
eukprot:1318304-Amphidinium_carterae.1